MTARRRILVVEPEAVTRRLVMRLLERLGHAVDAVGSAREAIAAAMRGEHDLVLVAHAPGELDPASVARAIRAQGHHPVVVVLTPDVSPADENAWLAADIATWLIKPPRSEDLARIVRQLPGSATAPVDPEAVPPPPTGLAVQEMLKTRFRDATPFYAEMLTVFVSTSREPIARMRAALATGAWEDLGAGAHLVKGGALTVGAVLAANQSLALEAWARAAGAAGPCRETVEAMTRLEALERTIDAIGRFAAQLAHRASEPETP